MKAFIIAILIAILSAGSAYNAATEDQNATEPEVEVNCILPYEVED